MQKRVFYVALGVPHDDNLDTQSVTVAYRKVINRYRKELADFLDEPTQPPLNFAVMRTYSERRHASLFDPGTGSVLGETEIDRYFDGFVPEVDPIPSPKRRARPEGKDLFVELRLAADEAKRGGLFPVHIPVVRQCPSCAEHADDEDHADHRHHLTSKGKVERGQLRCRLCHGTHRVTEDRMVEVTVPPGVMHDQLSRVAMEDVGLGHTDLIVHVVIS
jgi:DnaJ-class molecular chaperone